MPHAAVGRILNMESDWEFQMIRKTTLVFAFSLIAGAAQAQTCASNFTTEGIPLVTAINYKSWQIFPNLNPGKALDNAARAMAAEGFSGIRVDKQMGTLTALQETTGSGRPQTLRVVVRPSGKGSRVDLVFMVQQGQVAPEAMIRSAACRVIEGAKG